MTPHRPARLLRLVEAKPPTDDVEKIPQSEQVASYRECGSGDKPVLGRALTSEQARAFTDIARRLAALVLLHTQLDRNYHAACEMAQPLPGA